MLYSCHWGRTALGLCTGVAHFSGQEETCGLLVLNLMQPQMLQQLTLWSQLFMPLRSDTFPVFSNESVQTTYV